MEGLIHKITQLHGVVRFAPASEARVHCRLTFPTWESEGFGGTPMEALRAACTRRAEQIRELSAEFQRLELEP